MKRLPLRAAVAIVFSVVIVLTATAMLGVRRRAPAAAA